MLIYLNANVRSVFILFLHKFMNAIVGLCHFCEAHGPRPVFCTFTTDNEEHTTESSKSTVQCNGCTSLGPETVLLSKDGDGMLFCSRETVPNPDVTLFLRQAAIRSITCEVRCLLLFYALNIFWKLQLLLHSLSYDKEELSIFLM